MYKSDPHIICKMALVTYTVVHHVKTHPVILSTKAFWVSSENLFLCVLSALYVIMFLKSIRIKTLYITMVSISLIHHYSITA